MSAVDLAAIQPSVAPATAALAPVAMTGATTGSAVATATAGMCNWGPWLFGLIGVIGLLLMFGLARPATEWYEGLNNDWSWTKGSNKTVWAIVLAIVVLLMTYVSYRAYSVARNIPDGGKTANWILAAFIILVVLLVIGFALMFRSHNISAAFWVTILALLVSLFLTYLIYKVDRSAAWGMVPIVIWLIASSFSTWHLNSLNKVQA